MQVAKLFEFIRERHAIYERRARGEAKPWTQDKILQTYRFCNVYRELDRVTVWIRENWRAPNAEDPDVFFAMVVARLLNLPTSLEAIGYPVPWNAAHFKKILRERKEAGERVFNAAYMIHSNSTAGLPKTDYLANFVLTPLWKERADARPRQGDSLAQFFARLRCYRDMGSFMAAQVVADVKFTPPLTKATDWWAFAAPGPGSMRGMNWVLGRAPNAAWKGEEWSAQLKVLATKIDPLVKEAGMPRISAQDLQNCLCEYSGYCKVKYLGLRKKQLYPGV